MLNTIEVAARLPGTREELYGILSDYSRYSRWVPGLDLSAILAREGDVTVAEFRGRRLGDRTFNLELIRSPPGIINFHQIDSLHRAELSGCWEVAGTERLVGSPTATVCLRVRLDLPLLGFGRRRRAQTALRAGLDALGGRHRQLASTRPAERKQKVLEVVREAEGLKVWYLGETFVVPRAGGRR